MNRLYNYTNKHLQEIQQTSKLVTMGSAVITGIGVGALSMGSDPSSVVAALGLSGGVVTVLSGAIFYLSKSMDEKRTQFKNQLEKWRNDEGNTSVACSAFDEIMHTYDSGSRTLKIFNTHHSSSGLSSFPPIDKLTNLQSLHLVKHKIEEIPPKIGKLKNLQGLYLPGNKIKEIPPKIGKLKNLQHLYLTDNEIEKLPKEIGDLKRLQNLGLSNNKLTETPSEISLLKGLQNLWLSGNPLVAPPPMSLVNSLSSTAYAPRPTGCHWVTD